MTVPCDMYFTMDRKISTFLESTFLLYYVDHKKIKEAIEFVKQFDFVELSKVVNDNMLVYLEGKIEKL